VDRDGVDKRLDIFATALKGGMTVHDLDELELAYAPPYGSAKDPVNLKLEVPTLKGALEKTPAHMSFDVTSTDQQDIPEFLNEVRGLVRINQLVLINETRVEPAMMIRSVRGNANSKARIRHATY